MKHDEPATMCSLESETMYSLEWLRHERRKAWREGYAAGWKDQECDFPPHTTENPYTEGNEMKVKKTLMDMIVKWHQAGYALDEIAPLVPQVPKAEVAAIIHQHDKETRL